jgi:hypothetical protein
MGSPPRASSVRRLLLLLAGLSLSACGGGGGGAGTVTRTTVGDTLFVVTTRPATDPGPLFEVEQDLSIGVAEGEDAYMFVGIDAVSADEQGRIYVSCQRDGEVRIFDATGRFVTRFGRRGNGPGEFNSNYWGWFRVAPCGAYLTVEDLPRLRVFDRRGVFVKTIDLQPVGLPERRSGRVSAPIHWLPGSGRLVFAWRESGYQQPTILGLVVSGDGLDDMLWLPRLTEPEGAYGDGVRALSIPYTASFVWTLSGDRWLAWGIGDRLRLTRYDLETGDWSVAEVPTEPEPVTAEEIAKFKTDFLERPGMTPDQRSAWEPLLHQMPFPTHHLVVEDLVGDDQGRIWVQRASTASWASEERDEVYHYDVLAPDGALLGYVELPRRILYIRDGCLYAASWDPHPMAERWRLTAR